MIGADLEIGVPRSLDREGVGVTIGLCLSMERWYRRLLVLKRRPRGTSSTPIREQT
jgi:hypothetical protein